MSPALYLACLLVATFSVDGRPSKMLKRNFGGHNENSVDPFGSTNQLFLKATPPPEVHVKRAGDLVVLECEAAGFPNPTIHWLFRGVKVPQGGNSGPEAGATYEKNKGFGLAVTRSRLFLDCMTPDDQGEYTCVADSPFDRVSSSSSVTITDSSDGRAADKCIKKKLSRGVAARIYMASVNRLAHEGRNAQLYCRAEGNPSPRIEWYDNNNSPIGSGTRRMKVLPNGDLVIKNSDWQEDMGEFTCKAYNDLGSDSSGVFVYPTTP